MKDDRGRMNDEQDLHTMMGRFIVHPSLFILHRSSFVLHPSSFILSLLRKTFAARFTLLPSLFTLLFISCATATAPPPSRVPQWTTMPASVLDALCANFRDEGISTETTVNVVKTAQRSLITPQSMQTLAESQFYHGKIDLARAATAAADEAVEIPLTITHGCAWRPIEPGSGARYHDTMTLELSPPIANPFARNSAGIFARMALGGEAPTWYWMPLIPRGDTWTAGRLTILAYRQ
ncbi:MAG: hypothetical protein QOK37_2724 [Thermoanaerobaculia bacterium]|nr:hypothetical protein [Thermoanaerobaculia bacterium]